MKHHLTILCLTLATLLWPAKLFAQEPYAVLSDINTVLTFYYDGQKAARGGMDVGPFYLFTKNDRYNTSSGWDDKRETITNVVFDPSFASCTTITSTAYWFYGMENVHSISGLEYLNTGNVMNMGYMFYGCSSLTALDVTHFDTGKVMNMGYMFSGCSGLTSLDVSNFNTGKGENMWGMFQGCSSLTALDVTNFDTGNVTNMHSMFRECSGLTSLDVTNFNTGNVTVMDGMFMGCSGLTSLDVTNFETGNVTYMVLMFYGCSGLTSLDVTHFDTGNVTDMTGMFYGCSSLTALDVTHFDTGKVTNMGYMFSGCSGLTALDVTHFNTGNVTYMSRMFSGCSGLTSIYAGEGWSTETVTDGSEMFLDCTSLVGGNGTAYDANHTDYSYAHIDKPGEPGYLTDRNAPVTTEVVATPTFVINDNTLTISTTTSGASIHYTMDGTTPTAESTLYSRAIILTHNCTVRAIAVKEGMENSEEGTLEVGGLTKTAITPKPTISREGNTVAISIPGISENYIDATASVAVEPASWGGSAPKADLSGEWTCTVYNNGGDVSETYPMTLNSDGSGIYPDPCLSGSWTYNNGTLTLDHFKLSSGDNYNYDIYSLTATNPDNPIEFTGTRTRTVGNAWTENNSTANVKLTYNGTSLGVKGVTTDDGRETTAIIADEGDTEKTGTMLQQSVTGLDNGYYTVEMFAKSQSSSAVPMATDVTYLFANGIRLFIPVEADREIKEHNIYQIGVEVTDGTLNLGLGKEKNGANWHALQIKSLRRHALATDQPIEATAYYTLDGTTPTTSSPQYTTPIELTQSCTVKAIAVANSYLPSEVAILEVEIVPSEPEPYAVLSDNNTVLTFYYDDQKAARGGMDVGPFDDPNYPSWFQQRESITSVVFDASFNNCKTITSTAYWFCKLSSLTAITGLEYLNTGNVTNMRSMFYYCSGLTSLDVTHFDTGNVTNMYMMFSGCSGLTALDVTHFDTGNVTDMSWMFFGCSSLTALDVTHFDTGNVTSMYGMFWGCRSLTSLDVTNFNTGNVTRMDDMFHDCSGLTALDVTNFNTGNVTNMLEMFVGCSSLTSLDVTNFNTGNVTNMDGMFSGCSSLTSLDVTNFNTGNVTDMSFMFDGCSGLTALDVSNFDTKNVTSMVWMFVGCSSLTSLDVTNFNTGKVTDMGSMFSGCSSLTALDVTHFNTGNVTNLGFMFAGCSSLTALDVTNFNTGNVTGIGGMFQGCSSLTSLDVTNFNTGKVTNMNAMFGYCSSLTSLDVTNFNTGNVTDMSFMFDGCSGLTALDVSNFDTKNVTSMVWMFVGCSSLTSLDVTNFNTGKVTDMGSMFSGCSSLTALDVTHFNTGNVTNLGFMFAGCSSLTALDVTNFNTGNVTYMRGMFFGCSGLTSLDVTHFNTGNVTDMGGMFENCSGLTSLDLSSFNTSKVIYDNGNYKYGIKGMFSGCSGLTTIYVGDGWTTTNLTQSKDVFKDCTHLVGGAGTHYDANHTDYTYARIDKPGEPGYLTDKNAPAIADAEPYAVLSDDNAVLTFYYDGQKAARGGMDVGPFLTFGENGRFSISSGWDDKRETITNVVFDPSFASCTTITSTAYWFYGMKNVHSILDLEYLNTGNVTDMRSMFSGCSGLTALDVTHFDTGNVTSMYGMFSRCSGLTALDVTNFDTGNVTDMGAMFFACIGLTSLDVTNFNTGKVKYMKQMFSGCSGLTSLDVSNFDTGNVTDMGGMFRGCSGLTALDVTHFDSGSVKDMGFMFYGCSGLTSLDVTSFDTGKVTDMSYMFRGCSGLTSLDVTGFKTDNVTDIGGMFEFCSGLTSLDLSSFNTSKVIYDNGNYKYGIKGMFSGCSGLTTIYVGDGWTTTNLTQSPDVFKDCTHLVGGAGTHYDENHTDYTYAHIDGGPSNPGYFTAAGAEPWTEPNADPEPYAVLSDNNTVLTFYYDDQKAARGGMGVGPFNTLYDRAWYDHNEDITSVIFDTSFANCTSIISTKTWFNGMYNLSTITGIEYLNTANVTNMNSMFAYCGNVTSLDLSHFDTANVTNMDGMFAYCRGLTSLNISSFDTNNVTDMNGMFYACSSLSSLDVNHFNTEKVTRMDHMFYECSSLTTLDLSSFNTKNVSNMGYMCGYSDFLETIYVGSEWSTAAVADGSNMFINCTHLVGGAGTKYDANHTDYTYAHIDGGPSNPGYFTDKNAPVITETVATPTFNVNGNDLSIVSTTDGASIYYTTDGTDPTTASTLYTIPVNLTQNCTVKAFAVKDGCIDSDVATFNVDWFQVVVRIIQNGTTVEMEATPADAEIHYTTDGSEPTAESTLYTEPLTPATDMTIRAIGLRDGFNASDIVSFNYSVGIVTVATPTFTANEAANTVSIETATEGATIYYTLDGSEPTTASTFYNGPVVLTRNCTVKAIAVCEGYYDSYVSSFDVNWFYAERPVMALDYASGTLTITCATAGSIIYYIIGDGETQAYNGTVTLTDNSTVRAWATAEGYDNSAEATLKPIQNGTADGQTFRISGAVTAQELLFLRNVMGSQVEHLDMADATLTDGGLADEAFRGMGLLTAQLPKSVGTVGSRLFNGCRRLAAVVWNAPTDITATALEGIGNPNLLLYVGSETTGRNAGVRNRIVNGTAQEITLSDPTATSASDCNFFCPIAFTANHISYSHIYTQQTGMDGNSRGWETLALPFDVQQVEHRVKGAVVPFGNSLDAPHFWLYELDGTGFATATEIKANRPYIIAMPQHPDYAAKYCLGGDSITFSAANAAVPVTAPQQATAGAKTLHANFTAQAASDDIFAINIGDPYDDTHPEGSIFLSARRAVRPFEAYTTTTASGVRFIELFDDEADGIMEIECAQRSISDQSSNGYDLSGRRIADGQHRRQLPHKRLIINRGKVRTAK